MLLLLSASGAMLMAAANDLIVLFLGLEILSIALYVLAGFHRRRAGVAGGGHEVLRPRRVLVGDLPLRDRAHLRRHRLHQPVEIANFLAENVVDRTASPWPAWRCCIVGLGFKVAAVPFHTWTPDVYQGAPTPVTGFMAAAPRPAGFAGLLRVFLSAFPVLRLDWQPIIWVLAVLTLLVGSVLAVVQTDIKRMLAYSSISHAGYVLIGLQAATDRGVAGALFYLFAYTFMVLGSFAVVTLVGRRRATGATTSRLRGLSGPRPGLALAFTVFLLAQAGVPFTTGFLAKFYVICAAAVDSGSYILAVVIAMLAAVIAAFFYLRIIGSVLDAGR